MIWTVVYNHRFYIFTLIWYTAAYCCTFFVTEMAKPRFAKPLYICTLIGVHLIHLNLHALNILQNHFGLLQRIFMFILSAQSSGRIASCPFYLTLNLTTKAFFSDPRKGVYRKKNFPFPTMFSTLSKTTLLFEYLFHLISFHLL